MSVAPSEYHGVDGPLNVADLRYVNPLTRAFIEAAVAVGYARNDDFNGAAPRGRRTLSGHAKGRATPQCRRRLLEARCSAAAISPRSPVPASPSS